MTLLLNISLKDESVTTCHSIKYDYVKRYSFFEFLFKSIRKFAPWSYAYCHRCRCCCCSCYKYWLVFDNRYHCPIIYPWKQYCNCITTFMIIIDELIKFNYQVSYFFLSKDNSSCFYKDNWWKEKSTTEKNTKLLIQSERILNIYSVGYFAVQFLEITIKKFVWFKILL